MNTTAPQSETPDSASAADSKKSASVIELLASRICHDLVSPVGAINNGIEYLEEMDENSSAEERQEGLNLIAHSASAANAKLMAFRIAYGAGGRDSNIKPEDVQKAFSALISADGKISQTWDPYGNLGPKPLPLGFCKILMGGLMLAQECLIKGGYVSVRPTADGQTLIIAESDDTVLLRDNVEAALKQELSPEELDPRLVHPYAISVIADHYGYSIRIKEKSDTRVVFLLTSPAAPAAPVAPAA